MGELLGAGVPAAVVLALGLAVVRLAGRVRAGRQLARRRAAAELRTAKRLADPVVAHTIRRPARVPCPDDRASSSSTDAGDAS